MATLNFLNLCQTVVVNIGLLVGSIYCGYLVAEGEKTVGDYVLFGSYILQLMVPLNWLGTLYRFVFGLILEFDTLTSSLSLLRYFCFVLGLSKRASSTWRICWT
jgi:ATP-binding cassette subfamily B (MDR/TAP) protein 6